MLPCVATTVAWTPNPEKRIKSKWLLGLAPVCKGPYGPEPGPGPNPDWAPTRPGLGLYSHIVFFCKTSDFVKVCFSDKLYLSCEVYPNASISGSSHADQNLSSRKVYILWICLYCFSCLSNLSHRATGPQGSLGNPIF